MELLYSIYYNGEPFLSQGKKYIYFTLDSAQKSMKSLAKRRIRLMTEGWKLLDNDEKNKLVNEEILKFHIVEYLKK